MTTRHKLISIAGAVLFTAGFFALSLLNNTVQEKLFGKLDNTLGAAIVAAAMLALALILFLFMRQKNPVILAFCFIPVTAVWISFSEGPTWLWIAFLTTVLVAVIGSIRWTGVRNSTISWAGAGTMGVVLALCAALASLTIG